MPLLNDPGTGGTGYGEGWGVVGWNPRLLPCSQSHFHSLLFTLSAFSAAENEGGSASRVPVSLLDGETSQRISTIYSGLSGFRSTQGYYKGTTVCRYNTFIMNLMANPVIYHAIITNSLTFPYTSWPPTSYDLSKSEFMIFWARIADASLGGLRREAALFAGYNLHKDHKSLTPVTNVRKASEGKIALQSIN